MSDTYYILEDGEQTGPFTIDELIEREPDIHTRILSPNEDNWQDACDLPELYEYFIAQGLNFPTEDNLASFWIRAVAFIIDMVLLSIVMDFVLVFLASNRLISASLITSLQSPNSIASLSKIPYRDLLLMQGIFYAVLIIYNSVCESSAMKGSVGKKICRLVVVDQDGTGVSFPNALLRGLGKAVSVYFIGVGFLSVLWTEHRQALQDFVAKTYVVKKGH